MQPLVEVKLQKARCCTPRPDTAAIRRTFAKYVCCIPTALNLGIIAAFRAFQHSFYRVQLLIFLFPVVMVFLLKLILKESRAQYTGSLLCVFSCGMTAILGVNLESMVSFGDEGMVHVLFLCNVCTGSCPAVVEKSRTCGVETEPNLSRRLSGFCHHLAWLYGRGASPWERANTEGQC